MVLEAEDQLRDKELGCFLIRLSDRAIGYILSYKGRDRCRHFVINQNKAGQFIVSGDTETHDNLTDLIEYYKISPIEPFGEYLTCPCSEADNHELYDEIQFGQKGKPVLSVQAVKSIWNQRNEMSSEEPPPLPPKSNKKLHKLSSDSAFEKAVPLGKNCNQAPPTQHKKSPSLRNALSRSLEDKGTAHSQVLYAQINQSKLADKTQAPTSNKETPNRLKDQQGVGSVPIKNGRRTPSPPSSCIYSQAQEPKTVQSQASGPRPSDSTVYTELSLVECRSKSLPLLDDGSDDHHTYRLCTPPPTPAKLSPTIPSKSTYYTVPETYSLQDQHATYKLPPSVTLCSSSSLDKLFNNPLYQTVTRVCASQDTMSVSYKERSSHKALRASFPQALDEDPTYAQVPNETISNHLFSENTYEQIPDRHHKMSSEMQLNNTYETIPDKSSKQSESVWSLKVGSAGY
ncbi:SH2 domain-containing protein 7 [Amia ocellicauda]|uniref:SH2 domain-containing protein 7 n=1 Tax=Amia ocellicauda TaxID=2972642 RepID=UPI003464703E